MQGNDLLGFKAPKGWKFQEINQNDFYLLRTGRKGDWNIKLKAKEKDYKDDWISIYYDKNKRRWMSHQYKSFSPQFIYLIYQELLTFTSKKKALKFMTLWAKVMEIMDNTQYKNIKNFMLKISTNKIELIKFEHNSKVIIGDAIIYTGSFRKPRSDEIGSWSVIANTLDEAKRELQRNFNPDGEMPFQNTFIVALLNKYMMPYRKRGMI